MWPQMAEIQQFQDQHNDWEGNLENKDSRIVENRLEFIQGIARQNTLPSFDEDEGSTNMI